MKEKAMNREAFEYVFIHALCLDELGRDDQRRYEARREREALATREEFDRGIPDPEPKIDLVQYLQSAYARLPELAAQIDDVMARIDMHAMDIWMYCVPEDLSPLNRPLDADDMEKWLYSFRTGHYGLGQLVKAICALYVEKLPESPTPLPFVLGTF
jgi:hypothetical protein